MVPVKKRFIPVSLLKGSILHHSPHTLLTHSSHHQAVFRKLLYIYGPLEIGKYEGFFGQKYENFIVVGRTVESVTFLCKMCQQNGHKGILISLRSSYNLKRSCKRVHLLQFQHDDYDNFKIEKIGRVKYNPLFPSINVT